MDLTRPDGKAARVRAMFTSIAPRYDLLNHLLSLNLDRRWRRAAVQAVAPRPGERVLDACAGTLDLALALSAEGAVVVGLDFCRDMLLLGRSKAVRAARTVHLVEADAGQLPFGADRFDAVTVAFGIRNLEDPAAGLAALVAPLRPGGRIAVLEFARPRNRLFRSIYYLYFQRILPRIGALVSGESTAYTYLPASVMEFLDPEQLVAILERQGMRQASFRSLTLGSVVLVTARKPTAGPVAASHP